MSEADTTRLEIQEGCEDTHQLAQTTNISPQISEADTTRLEIQMPSTPSSTVIGNNKDTSDITQDVDALVRWRYVGKHLFPCILEMSRQFLTIPEASATDERVFRFAVVRQ
jgi:hypothetical protein